MKHFIILLLMYSATINAQNTTKETISFYIKQKPKVVLENGSRSYSINVKSPYNLTAAEVNKNAEMAYQEELLRYAEVVSQSEIAYEKKMVEHEKEEQKAKDKFEIESQEFNKLSQVERLVLIDQGKKPKLNLPVKPVYYKPTPPVEKKPNLEDYLIVDNDVLASLILIEGLQRVVENSSIKINIEIDHVSFQDNSGQTFAKQPTRIYINNNGKETQENYFYDYQFISSMPSNKINKTMEEKRHLNKVVDFINAHLNELYGYPVHHKSINLIHVKNKGKYDELEQANIYVSTNLKKLQPEASDETVNAALLNMKKGIDLWIDGLGKIEYKNSKADFNSNIARTIFFNLMELNIALGNKAEAEKYLNQFQENQIHIQLSTEDKKVLGELEREIYKSN